ncbi:tRNA preQ1(34) S-adenosylmethionine ribosyltransferase-isomerase QueA [bacterium]|nr:tRNA preQ1(34) S-adenosylmethionine ribosyltransferase-isomerase QueA [bacterium]
MHEGIPGYDFDLPAALIAQEPAARRDASRLLRVGAGGAVAGESPFGDLPRLLRRGDLLVLNESRVLPARLWCRRADTGGRVEVLLVEPAPAATASGAGAAEPSAVGAWLALARPARRLRAGLRLVVEDEPDAPGLIVVGRAEGGFVVVAPAPGAGGAPGEPLAALAGRCGQMPLPPYIRREAGHDPHEAADRERYQTVYAARAEEAARSVAAPTAGLHFTPDVLAALAAAGVGLARLRLHVGPGTFQPPTPAQLAARRLHAESFELPAATARAIATTRAAGGRVIAVGTTALRGLETAARLPLPGGAPDGARWTAGGDDGGAAGFFSGEAVREDGHWAVRGRTRLFIAPPDRVTAVDGLLTNFHLPGSSLLMLVAALLGGDAWRGVYHQAVSRGLRFYSYGDCMLALPGAAGPDADGEPR